MSRKLGAVPTGTPHALIVRRYLSLLDTAVELELPGYRGPRLPRRQQVPIFPQPLTTDRARCKYRWMGRLGPRGGDGPAWMDFRYGLPPHPLPVTRTSWPRGSANCWGRRNIAGT